MDGEEQRKKRGCWEAQWRRGTVGCGGRRAAERPPPFVPTVTTAGELSEEAVTGRCGGRRGREEAAALIVEVEVQHPERGLGAHARPGEATAGELARARGATAAELAYAPARPGGRARGHLAASAAPRRQRFASLEREDAFLHRGWPPRVCLVPTKFPNFPSHPLSHRNIKYSK